MISYTLGGYTSAILPHLRGNVKQYLYRYKLVTARTKSLLGTALSRLQRPLLAAHSLIDPAYGGNQAQFHCVSFLEGILFANYFL